MTMPSVSSRRKQVWLLAGVILLAVNLRAAITSVPPILSALENALRLSATAVDVLTTLPVLCLGLFSFLAPRLARRIGERGAVSCSLGLISAGAALRALPWPVALYAGTVLAGSGIALGNVLIVAVIKRHYTARLGTMTGLAMMLMALSGAVAAGLAVPVSQSAGWQIALALWALPAAVGSLAWGAAPGDEDRAVTATARKAEPTGQGNLLRSPVAGAIIAFLGLVCLAFYVLVAWLPEIMQSRGYSAATAGTMMSVMLALGVPLGLAMPVAAARMDHQGPLVVAVFAAKVVGLSGIWFAPSAGWAWVLILGIATGGAFPLAMTLLSLRTTDAATTARLSGVAQSGGYLLAGFGPFAIGFVHSLSGGWDVPLMVLLVLAVPELLAGLYAARPGVVRVLQRGRHGEGQASTARPVVFVPRQRSTSATPGRPVREEH